MKSKKAFTLIELLVVIAIIGLLATLAVIALNNARAKGRDAKRVADVKQIQTALELYFNDKGYYPTADEFNSGSILSTSTNGTTTYMAQIPASPIPADGSCTGLQNRLAYFQIDNGRSYSISYCIGNPAGSLAAGPKCATSDGVFNSDCSGGGGGSISGCGLAGINDACPSGKTTADAGCYCGGGMLFYVDPNNHKYYIAAPYGWYNGGTDMTAAYGCYGTWMGASGTTIGTGPGNSAIILNTCATAGIAARLTHAYAGGGYSDWFLPSIDELNQMYINLKTAGLGGFSDDYGYISSSEAQVEYANYEDFSNGHTSITSRNAVIRVRPIRAAIY